MPVPPPVEPDAPDRRYTLRTVYHLDMAKGGWAWVYEIRYEGKPIGGACQIQKNRSAPVTWIYTLGEDEHSTTFSTSAAFKAAHRKSLEPIP